MGSVTFDGVVGAKEVVSGPVVGSAVVDSAVVVTPYNITYKCEQYLIKN